MDKNTVLNQTTQEAIYKYFYGDGFSVGNKISSPFSEDKHASFKVFKNLSFKCFSTGKQGDVFQFVADLNNLDCKTQFSEVLEIISTGMNLMADNAKKPIKKEITAVVDKNNPTSEL